MPELPEVDALARVLDEHTRGRRIASLSLASLSALKTFDPPPTALLGEVVDGVTRHGKFIDISAGGLHLIWHLARAGWTQWRDELPEGVVRPGKGPLALRVGFVTVDGELAGGFDLTEAGTTKKLAIYVVRDPQEVPGIARLGPEPLSNAFTPAVLDAILNAAGRSQLKGVLRNQSTIAGIGNAYSDEILHAAKLSPFHPASTLDSAQRTALFDAIQTTLREAINASIGHGTGTLKSEKKANLRVHGKAGNACPVCGDVIREVSFADSSLQYCATCQTGGKPLADRRMSRLLK